MPTTATCHSCGSKLTVPKKLIAAGQVIKCPKCGSALKLSLNTLHNPPAPQLTGAKALVPFAMTGAAQTSPSLFRDPIKLGFILCCISFIFAFLILALVIYLVDARPFNVPVLIIALVLVPICGFCGSSSFQLFLAKKRAIHAQGRVAPLFFGLARLITWEQNEGLILLKDKQIQEVIYGPRDGGGIRIIYPVLGEELKAHLPLTLTLSHFHDDKVLTREAIQLKVRVALWWKVADLEKYYFVLSRGVHGLRDTGQHVGGFDETYRNDQSGAKETAEVWITTLTESCLRQLISETSAALIVSKRAVMSLPNSTGGATNAATPDVIAHEVLKRLQPKVRDYGLEIDRIEAQEVQLPPHIQEAVDNVWIASTMPVKSEHEARALQIQLQHLAAVIGNDAVAVNEIMKNFRGASVYGSATDMLQTVFAKVAPSLLPGPAKASLPALPTTAPSPPSPKAMISPIKIKCPCGAMFTVPNYPSTPVSCPGCGQSFGHPPAP